MRALLSLLLASAVLISPRPAFAGQAEDESTALAWKTLTPGYYVEQNDEGIADCSRPDGVKWLFVGPDVRDGANIFDYFGMPGAIGFNFAGRNEDYLLLSVIVLATPEDKDMLNIIRQSMGGMNPAYLRGTGLSRGGLDVSTRGELSGHMSVELDSGLLHIHSLSFSDGGETKNYIESGDNLNTPPTPTGVWPDGRELHPFQHCSSE